MKTLLVLVFVVAAVTCFPKRQLNNGCNSFCPMYVMEFCGSDGVTYNSNPCFLKSKWCTEGRVGYEEFTTLHYGKCTGTELLAKKTTTETLLMS